jgi:outer membrane protein assembly factor BamB
VYVGTGDPDDGVQALRLKDGQLLWHWRSVVRDVSDTDVGAGPLLYRDKKGAGRVVVGGKDGWLYSLEATTGREVWKTRLDEQVFGSPAVMNGQLYAVGVASGQTILKALDAEDGREIWQRKIGQKGYSSPVVAGKIVYLGIGNGFGAGNGGIEVLNTSNGQLVQQVNLQTTASSSPTVLANWVLLGTNNGNVNAFVRQ